MIYVAFEGGLGNQMFQYTFGRYMQELYHENVTFDTSKYSFEKVEFRNFELEAFNISDSWIPAKQKKHRITRFGIGYILYLIISAPYLWINNYRTKRGQKEILGDIYERLINFLGFYRVHYGKYTDPYKSMAKNKYIRGHWFWKDMVIKMDKIVRIELRVITSLSAENSYYLTEIKDSNSVGVHVRRGDFVELGLIVCDLDYYKQGMDIIANKVSDPVFFIFSDDIQWVRENLNTDEYNVVYVDNQNSPSDDMRLLYSCKHFIVSNSTFSWWGAYLGDYPEKIVIAPKFWNDRKEKSPLILDSWIAIDNI